MIITIPIQKENDDGFLSNQNGLTDLALRYAPFTANNYSLTAVAGVNGRYETTTSITGSGLHKLYKDGVEQKSWGGNNGNYLFAETNLLDVNSFNVGDTLIVQSLSGTKYFVPTSATGSITGYIQAGTSNNNLLQWSSTANTYYSKSLKQIQGYRSYCAKLYHDLLPLSEDQYQTYLTENLYYNQFGTGARTWTKVDTGQFTTLDSGIEFSLSANVVGYDVYQPVYNPTTYTLVGYYKLISVSNKPGIETYNTDFQLADGIFVDGCVIEIKTIT